MNVVPNIHIIKRKLQLRPRISRCHMTEWKHSPMHSW